LEHSFHLHMISDATGETLIAVSHAVVSRYEGVAAIEHLYPMVRSEAQLDRVLAEIKTAPGVVLYTLVAPELAERLERACQTIGVPTLSVLQPIFNLFQAYLGATAHPLPGAQHMLNAHYFNRIDALNYTMAHDDGQMSENYEDADVLLIGVSRTSKTPTSIYLANRGIKMANVPVIPNMPLPRSIFNLKKPLIVGLVASAERLVQVRQNRLESLHGMLDSSYVDPVAVHDELIKSRKLFAHHGWPVIDVTRRSIEETAAAIIDLHKAHRGKLGT
jgi:regulator of PEP synthase PpsR (kinase-PPPase family)